MKNKVFTWGIKKKIAQIGVLSLVTTLLLIGCGTTGSTTENKSDTTTSDYASISTQDVSESSTAELTTSETIASDTTTTTDASTTKDESNTATTTTTDTTNTTKVFENLGDTIQYNNTTYKIIAVDGGDLSGTREKLVAVEIGFGNREYWGFTNEYGQLTAVIAEKIVIQNDDTEEVNENGRYYDDEAAVPGTEQEDLDQGHVIADSLGGVSNAYNITPQDSTLNRHGDQAYMERVIQQSGGCENFVATITYPDTSTQIPSHYHYEYDLNGNHVTEDFDNVNPEGTTTGTSESETSGSETPENPASDSTTSEDTTSTSDTTSNSAATESHDISTIDTNGNGSITIAEAKAAGFSMPVHSTDWIYQYMDDRDGDGVVGE